MEQTIQLWVQRLQEMKLQIAPLFGHASVVRSAGVYLDGLLGTDRRKTGWTRAETAGDLGPWKQQAVLGRSLWDADALRDLVRTHVVDHLGHPEAVLVLDDTGFLKQGKASCGVHRQYTGSAGKVTNCQVGVFAAYATEAGAAMIDRALYLPKAWTEAPERLRAAKVPETVAFATKPQLACAMIQRAIAADVPFRWVAADAGYGVGALEQTLRRGGKGYVLGVSGAHAFWPYGPDVPEVEGHCAASIAAALPDDAWRRLSAGWGTQGPRWYDWTYLPLGHLDGVDYGRAPQEHWTRGLLIRRLAGASIPPDASDVAYFTTWCPRGTPIETLVQVEGRRWAIEDSFEAMKTELGLTHNESRSWHGWHRHVTLVMLAYGMMVGIRANANAFAPPIVPTPQARSLPTSKKTRPTQRLSHIPA